MRDIQRNVRGEFDWETAIERSQLEAWKVSPFIGIKEISKYSTLKSLILGNTAGETDE